jgi:plastocyanin
MPDMKILLVLALVLPGALVGCSRERSGDVVTGPGGPDAVAVVMVDSRFDPETLELEAGAEVALEVRNDGSAQHNLTIDELDLSTGTMSSGDVVTATVTVPDGTIGFRCTFHPGMDGEIVAT